MANRVKEDERNERIIRGLLKLPDNRRCINCNSLGPQYVCTNFWTFVCTTCSGIHREFTHRVKSVSMAKFTSQEVSALQGGGNQRAREIFLKEWDPQRQSSPDGSNVERLRDFIKHVYVDRRYSGERNYGKPPSMKGDKDEFSGNRRADSYQGGSRSPPYEDAYERRYGEMSSPGGRSDERNSSYYDERRSPGYDQGRSRGEYGRSPTRPEVINDWRREDRFGNTRKADDSSMSPARQKDSEISSPPVARPVREILGDNVVPLRIAEPPKANVTRVGDVSSQPQQTTSSSSSVSANAHPVEVKLESNKSLIDFSDPEPPAAAAVLQQTTISESSVPVASTTNDNNWASFDINPEVKVSETPSNMNPLESVLSQLSVSAPPVSGISGVTSAPVAAPQGNASMFPYNAGAPTGMPVNNLGAFLPTGVLAAAPGIQTQPVNTAQAGQWSNIQFPMSRDSSASQHILPTPGGTNQPWSLSIAPETSVGGTQVITNAASGNSFAGMSQPSAGEVKFSGRKELPADLFTMSYPSYYAPMPGWQTRPPHGMGFPMPYPNTAVPLPTIPQMPKSANPFDVNEPPSVQAQSFPSMASLQGALPNMPPPSGLQRTSSLGSPLMPWNPSQPVPYQTGLASHTPSYGLAMPPRPYMAQQLPNNLPSSGHMGTGAFAGEGAASFAARNSEQQYGGRYSAPATPQPFSSSGGNPFG